jgi:hypothetical protein
LSVLICLPSLVIPRHFPGGIEPFVDEVADPDIPAQQMRCDPELIVVSFGEPELLGSLEDMLRSHGIERSPTGAFGHTLWIETPVASVPCDWLECEANLFGEGVYYWLKGSAPTHYQPSESSADGAEEGSWLDLHTGKVFQGRVRQGTDGALTCVEECEQGMDDNEELIEETDDGLVFGTPLLDTLREMLNTRQYKYQEFDDDSIFMVVRGPLGAYSLFLTTDEKREVVRVTGSYGAAIPEPRRRAIGEAVSRANMLLGVGNFDLDFDDGELRFRNSVDVEGGLFTARMADNLLGCTLYNLDRYADAFMRIAFGEIEPLDALKDFA